jgi:hypothetical protein
MKEVLITINFTDPTDKFWWDCGIKNQVHSFDEEKQTIHDLIKEICEDEGMELSYKGKPRGNVYRDNKGGGSRVVGYMYRGKGEIYDRNMTRPIMVFWDVWVEVRGVTRFELEKLDK